MIRKIMFMILTAMGLTSVAQEKIEILFSNPEARDRHIDMSDLSVEPGMTVYRPAKPNGEIGRAHV